MSKLIPTAIKMINNEFSSFDNGGILDHSYIIGWMNHIDDLLVYFTHEWSIKEGVLWHELSEDRKELKVYAREIADEWIEEHIDSESREYDEKEEEYKIWCEKNNKKYSSNHM